MVGRVLALMNREIRGLHEAAYLLAVFAFLSQVLALVRDRTFAHLFGAGPTLDAYFSAFRIPDLLFAFLALFVSSFALIPLIAKRGGTESRDAQSLVGSVLLVFGVCSVIISAVLFVCMPYLVPVLFPGFSSNTQDTVVFLSRIMLVQPVFLGLSSVVGSVIQSSRKFFVYALAPIFYNLGIIAGAFFLYPSMGTAGLGWGVVLGAMLHFGIQCVPLVSHSRAFSPRFNGALLPDTLQVVRASLPRSIALTSNQLLLLFLVGIASLSAAGSVASLSFAFNLQSLPLSIIGVSYAAALFPSLALLFSQGEKETFVKEVWAATRHIIFWTAPAIALLVVLRAHIVRVILGSGNFTWSDTRLTAAILAAFSVSLIAQAVLLIFSRAYYASGREKTPIVMNVGIALASGGVAFVTFNWFQHADVSRYFVEHLFRIDGIPGSEVVMVALSYSLVMLIGAVIFAVRFVRDFGFERSSVMTLFRSFSAAIISGAAAYGTLQFFGPLLPTDTFVGIFVQGLSAGVVGVLAWVATLAAMKSQELAEAVAIAARLVKKK